MRLIKRNINSDGSGSVTLLPEEPEDMWHAYNLVLVGDFITASAVRRVTTESSSTGSTTSQRVHTNLTIRVKSLDFDPQAGELHVSGQIARENKHAKIGQHHTLDLELNRNFTIEKVVDGKDGGAGWDSVAQSQLLEATDPNKSTEAVALVMAEGIGNICFLTAHQTILRQKVEVSVPKKGGLGYERELQKFYRVLLETLLRQLETLLENKDSSATFPVLLASPGFVAQSFLKYINETAFYKGDKLLQDLVKRKAFVVVHSSSAQLGSLNSVLSSPEVKTQLQNTQYARETAAMDKLFTLMRKEDGRACYGPKHVEHAVDQGAVGRGGGVLLISNELFRSQEVATRRRWVSLVDRVRDMDGGEVRILSGDHESGKRLQSLGGIAAILTYPIGDMSEQEEEDEDEQ